MSSGPQRLQVALTAEADLRMEVTARTELLESLKAESWLLLRVSSGFQAVFLLT